MAEEMKDESGLQRYLGPIVGLLVLLFSLTKAYERAELVSYDWRFNIRNSIFGLPEMDARLGTIEIDDLTLEVEGRWQNWTREEYVDVVDILGHYGTERVGFDIYFPDPVTKIVTEKQIRKLPNVDAKGIEGLLANANYDLRFAHAITEADNVYLAQYLNVVDKEHGVKEQEVIFAELDDEQIVALEEIRADSPQLMVPVDASTLTKATDFEPPIPVLRRAARGFAYAQTTEDFDGSRRRYPVVFQYKDILFPSIALRIACDQLNVPMSEVQVWPGEKVLLPNAQDGDGEKHDIEIPINSDGTMNVNWVGRWEETFVRYPHIALRDVSKRKSRQELLEKIKEIVVGDRSLKPNKLPSVLAEHGYVDKKAVRGAIVTWIQARGIESAVVKEPGKDAAEFWASKGVKKPQQAQLKMYSQIQRNNRVAQIVEKNPSIGFVELKEQLAEYDSDDLEQSFYFISKNLVQGRVSDQARPLYFYPYQVVEGLALTPFELKGKILFYGQTSTGSTDLSVIPFQGNYPMVGIYSNVLNTIFTENFISRMAVWQRVVVVLLLGLIMSLIIPRLKVLQGAILIVVLTLLFGVVAILSFKYGYWLEVVGPILTINLGYLVLTIYGYIIKEREKEFVQGAFGHYLSPAVVDQIMANPDMVNQLGGEERNMSAFFSDIASFSTISECLEPAQLVDFINGYLTEMCDIIESYGGTIDKFEGDAIVAFFGAPIYYDDHASRAVMSCIDQQEKLLELRERWNQPGAIPPRLEELRDRWGSQGRTFGGVRIGVTAGPMIVGNMGSRSRTDYTMMGDTVNLAARFESGSKAYGQSVGIMVNGAIYDQVSELVEGRKLDLIQVVGKEEPVSGYEILTRKGNLSPQMAEVLDLYNQGMDAFWAYEFIEARALFEKALTIVPTDGPSALYADRCEEFALNKPEDLVYRPDGK